MNTTKATVDFTRYKANGLFGVAKHIFDRMSANAATFPSPPVSMAALGAMVEDYPVKLAARLSRASGDVSALKAARAALNTALARLGGYVNDVAQGDPSIVILSGFPSYDTARTPDSSIPAAPEDLRLKHGTLRGSIVARYRVKRKPSTNEMHISTGNPNDEAGWRFAGVFQGQKATLSGLTPGQLVWVRVRTVGLRGVMGAWSDPREIMVV
ncbi:MAG: fibronectin type III domain-containing protein [Chthoniobacteraceae bacterium]